MMIPGVKLKIVKNIISVSTPKFWVWLGFSKSQGGPKGLRLEVGALRAPKLLVSPYSFWFKRGQRVGMYLKFNFCLLSKFKVLFMHQLSCLGRPLLLGGDFDSTLIFAENNSLSRISILGH